MHCNCMRKQQCHYVCVHLFVRVGVGVCVQSEPKRVTVLSLFLFAAVFTLVFLQEFLSNMESHRHRGHSVFENMRSKHLQVGYHS